MPTHWTYRSIDDATLFQGDIIARGPLLELLKQVHSHFCHPKYIAFVVLTQTCDLVRRGGKCKAGHITLAAVRSLRSLMPEFLDLLCDPFAPFAFRSESRLAVEQFLRRLLNQNEQGRGMFYLHPDADVGIGEPSAALLRVSISLRAHEHYALIQSARCGRLDTEYRNKLGWLTGNLYSRVDTTDWGERQQGEQECKNLIDDLIAGSDENGKTLWVPDAWVQAAKKRKLNLKEIPRESLFAALKEFAPRSGIDVAVAEVEKVTCELRTLFAEKQIEVFCERMEKDSGLMPLLRPVVAAALNSSLGGLDAATISATADDLCRNAQVRFIIVATIKDVAKARLKPGERPSVQGFIDRLKGVLIFDRALEQVNEVGSRRFGDDYLVRREEVRAAFMSAVASDSLLSHLEGVASASIAEVLPKLLSARLKNNTVFKSALRE